ncbi:hypothetical protein PNK_1705 [Candidatus Protochlamydia naegleriophila]|uniref:Uncharacterized protein n=1 Tax=Candidatus Protochlamydia naegleriophila TaxID=389348 RepID=A0A0U5JFD2_9BACT|nr:hypothetical protein [Candidatus Protochlamydia naegleriophila]CUI17314.1 hypothetical protein PNK_1705 [Candidatus Protochlamydia naegleriophila]
MRVTKSCMTVIVKELGKSSPLSAQKSFFNSFQAKYLQAMATEYEGDELMNAVISKINSIDPAIRAKVGDNQKRLKIVFDKKQVEYNLSTCSCANVETLGDNTRCQLNQIFNHFRELNHKLHS